MQRILALDIATKKTGWSLFVNEKYEQSGVIEAKGKYAKDRFPALAKQIEQLIQTTKPTEVGIEAAFVQKNPATVEYLLKLQGVAEYTALKSHANVISWVTTKWRSVLEFPNSLHTKDPIDFKNLSIKKAKEVSGKDPKDDNEADAICIGMAHVLSQNQKK